MVTGFERRERDLNPRGIFVPNWFRISPVMTTSIPLRMVTKILKYTQKSSRKLKLEKWQTLRANISKLSKIRCQRNGLISRFFDSLWYLTQQSFESAPLWPLRYLSVYFAETLLLHFLQWSGIDIRQRIGKGKDHDNNGRCRINFSLYPIQHCQGIH